MKSVTRATRTRRLRKKLRVAEFQELGFDVQFRLAEELSIADSNQFWDALIAQVEANGLLYSGHVSAFVYLDGRGTATDHHRLSLQSWLSARPEVSSVVVGPLVDAWHPKCAEPPFPLKSER